MIYLGTKFRLGLQASSTYLVFSSFTQFLHTIAVSVFGYIDYTDFLLCYSL
jgi:hypothetical protein